MIIKFYNYLFLLKLLLPFKLKKISPRKLIILITILVIIDQISKIYIKLNFPLNVYGTPPIVDWGFFKLLFVENQGMAMGAKLSDIMPFLSENLSKLLLTVIRLIAICGIGYWLKISFNNKLASPLFLLSLSLIFAGAIGNIIDSVFYGILFSHSYGQVATFMPDEGGYASIFYGSVVDMFQFPLISWNWPDWMPFWGGEPYTFFQYVFNFADTYVSIGVIIILFFNRKVLIQDGRVNS